MPNSNPSPAFVLLVDDDPSILSLLRFTLNEAGIPTESVDSIPLALKSIAGSMPSAVVLDLGLPGMVGSDSLLAIKSKHPDLAVVVVTGNNHVETAVKCMQLGAADFVRKPFENTRLIASVKSAYERGKLQARVIQLQNQTHAKGLAAIIGESECMLATIANLTKAIDTEVTVLLEGQSGTGKELFARAVHFESKRAAGPFVVVNCGAIPEQLIESELFGHQKGAFSGASQNRIGLFEQANGGTIFLDEIGELPADLQVRFLRVLQERSVRPVGANTPRPITARVVVATNRILADEVKAGRFRQDLFYRLSVFPVLIPSLGQRAGDVHLLADAFLERFCATSVNKPSSFSPEARAALSAYHWPGNVRELENVIQRAVILEEGAEVTLEVLPDAIVCAAFETHPGAQSPIQNLAITNREIIPMEVEERRILERALNICDGNVAEAAERLCIGRATLYRRIHSFKLKPDQQPTFEHTA